MDNTPSTAWVIPARGQPAIWQHWPEEGALQPGEVRIEGHFSALNYKDALSLTGAGDIARQFPLVAGQDISGVVTESWHPQFQPGDRVIATGHGLGEDHHGTFRSCAIIPGECAQKLPPDWSLEVAAAVGTAGFTAAYALLKMQQAGQAPDDGPVLITGASGGVGSHAIVLFSQAGFQVHALSRKTEHQKKLQALGATALYPELPLSEAVQKPILPPRWAGAVDTLGGNTLSYLLATTQAQGNVVCLGLVQSPQINTTVLPFILRGINLLGLTASHAPRTWRTRIWRHLFSHMPVKNYPIPYHVRPLADALRAARALLSGDNFGRIVLDLRSTSQKPR